MDAACMPAAATDKNLHIALCLPRSSPQAVAQKHKMKNYCQTAANTCLGVRSASADMHHAQRKLAWGFGELSLSEKVGWHAAVLPTAFVVRRRVELQKGILQVFVDIR